MVLKKLYIILYCSNNHFILINIKDNINRKKIGNLFLKKDDNCVKKNNISSIKSSINEYCILNSYNMSLLGSKSKSENYFWNTFNKQINNNQKEYKLKTPCKIEPQSIIDTKIILSNMKTSKKKLFQNVSKIENNHTKNSPFFNENNINNQEILSDFVDFNINNNISDEKENLNPNINTIIKGNISENISNNKQLEYNEQKYQSSTNKEKFNFEKYIKTNSKIKKTRLEFTNLKLEKDDIINFDIKNKLPEKNIYHNKEIIDKLKKEYYSIKDFNNFKNLISTEINNNNSISYNNILPFSNIFGSQMNISQKNISSLYDKRRGIDSFENSQSQSLSIMSNLSIKNVFDGKNITIFNKTLPNNTIIIEEESNLNITSVNTINLKSTLNDIVDGDLYYNNIQSNLQDIKEIAEENNNDNNEIIIQIILDEINEINEKEEISISNLSNKIYSENYLRDNIIDNKEKISKTFYNLLLTSQENNIDIIQEIFFGKIIKN